jgi:prepilin-type N-terminal cleavage/methylation domain-containing protein
MQACAHSCVHRDPVQPQRNHRRAQTGFTLVEVMIVVAVIGILAAVVVPSWIGESRKARGDSEINAMFAEIATKQEQYKLDSGVYLSASTCPSAPSSAGADFNATCVTSGSAWASLRVSPPESKLRCTYAVTAGAAGATLTPPTGFTVPNQPVGGWYYIVGVCDLDGQAGTNATYFQSSTDTVIQKLNAGS